MNIFPNLRPVCLYVILSLVISACESWQVKSREGSSPTSTPPNGSQNSGATTTVKPQPTIPPLTIPPQEPPQPEQIVILPPQAESSTKVQTLPKVGLIIGPGHLRSFIAVGILQELQKSKIPISSVIGMEWGSVPAGLFSIHGQANEVEWQMMKLKEKDFPKKGILSQKIESDPIKNLDGFLTDAFAAVTFEQLKISFTCLSLDLNKHQYFWMRRGELARSLQNCISQPPFFYSDSNLVAGIDLKLAADYLRQMGAGYIVFINLLPTSGDFFEKNQLNYPSEVLWAHHQQNLARSTVGVVDFVIETSSISIKGLDFENRRDMVRRGQEVGHAAAKKLSQKLGL